MRRACQWSACSLLAALLACMAPAAWAQFVANSTPNVVGSGARALGMGGAFIAVADDATAASWNPGGLTQLERPEFSLVYNWSLSSEDIRSSYHVQVDGDQELSLDRFNYLSFVYPIPRTIKGRNLVLSLNYQHKVDFDRQLDYRYRDVQALPGIFSRMEDDEYRAEGSLAAITPAVGFELTERLSAGIAMNIYDQDLIPDNEWSIDTGFRVRTYFNGALFNLTYGDLEEEFRNYEGRNYTFGLLWQPTEKLKIGAVYHTKYAGKFDYRATRKAMSVTLPGAFLNYQFGTISERRRLEWPSAYGVGVSYRLLKDRLTLSLDVTRREWDEFVMVDRAGRRFSPVTGLPKNISYHKATHTVRLGAEYLFFDEDQPMKDFLPSVRAGLMYDPEPASGAKDSFWGLDRGDGEPDDFYGATLGVGALIKNRVNVDLAYQFRWGNDVRRDSFGSFGTDIDVRQHEWWLSTVIYF